MDGITKIDITELLEDYVDLLKKSGVSTQSAESKLMREAVSEIKELRKRLSFQIKEAQENNNQRLRWMDKYIKSREFFEKTLKQFREEYEDECCCAWCGQYWTTLGGSPGECDGLHKDDCFKLDIKKYDDIIFEKE